MGLFKSEWRGMEKYYSLNLAWPLYTEYRGIFMKTLAVPLTVRERLLSVQNLGEVSVKFENFNQAVEVYISGQPSERSVSRALKPLKKELGREVKWFIDSNLL